MAGADVEKPETGGACSLPKAKAKKYEVMIPLVLRLLAFFATAAATLVMALNKETKTMVVALVGTSRVFGTVTAKFQHTPAFVFLVIVNSIASFHNLTLLVFSLLRRKFQTKDKLELYTALSDLVMVALVSAGSAAAAAMAELGKNGNKHARWNKICDRFDTFCAHGSGALMASFTGVGLMIALTAISITNLYKKQG